MKTKTTHTPTPWTVKEGSMEILGDSMKPIAGVDGIILGFVSDNNLVDTSCRDANAAFIIRAVNAHEELLRTLRHVAARLHGKFDYSEQLALAAVVLQAITKSTEGI